MSQASERVIHIGALVCLLSALAFAAHSQWTGAEEVESGQRFRGFQLRIQGMCRTQWGQITRATLHLPDYPLSQALATPRGIEAEPRFATRVLAQVPPKQFQISLEFEQGQHQLQARGSLVREGSFWKGRFEDYKVSLPPLQSSSLDWVKDPNWLQPAAAGRDNLAGTPLNRAEVRRILPKQFRLDQEDEHHHRTKKVVRREHHH